MSKDIQWESLELTMDADLATLKQFLRKVGLDERGVFETWIGTDGNQTFALQKRQGAGSSATLVSHKLGEEGEYRERQIVESQVADAAGFLGYQWFNYMPMGVGKVILSKEPPPSGGEEVFKAKSRKQ